MLPLLLALFFFAHLSLVGRAVFGMLGLRFGRARTWLFAPTLGLAVVGLLVMLLNQAGWPVAGFARPLMLLTLLGAVIILIRHKITVPRALLPFGLLALAALLLGGWPALEYGFGWVGYGNDDMTNYCLGAERFLRHGFYDIPTPADLSGGDYAQYFWMMHVVGMIRFGAEHMVALVAGLTGLGPVQIFMPVLLAFGLVQLWAVMGLAYTLPARRSLALVAGVLLVASPLWYCGTAYQLLAQVAGLALLAVILGLTARSHFPRGTGARIRFALGCALLIAAFSVFYPEVIPFLTIGWGLFMAGRFLQRRHTVKGLLPVIVLTLAFVLVLLRHNVISTSITLLAQAQEGMDASSTAARVSLFPYFLVPAGPAYLFGFDVIVAPYGGLRASLGLLAGFVGGIVALWAWWRGFRRWEIPAMLLAGMLVIGVRLFASGNGFGLFKLCMFVVPFLAIELARFGQGLRGRALRMSVLVLLLAAWLPGVWRYAEATRAGSRSGARELFDASASRGFLPPHPSALWAITASSPINKLLMLEMPHAAPAFTSQIVNASILGRAEDPYADWIWRLLPGQGDRATARRVLGYIKTEVYRPEKIHGLSFWSRSSTETPVPDPATVVVTSTAEVRSFNKLAPDSFPATPGLFSYTDLGHLANYLVFIQSTQGQHYYLGATGRIAVYKPQPDPYSAGGYFFMIGRHLLFRVINPSGPVRLRLSLTASILGAARTTLPPQATVTNGTAEVRNLGLVGDGSANVFSPPLEPAELHGASYLALDLGQPPLPIGLPAAGLHGIYHRSISLDTRLGLGYCRDISLISEADYAARSRPRELSRFPADLTGPAAVEYSGLYEDGWVSRRAFVVLGSVNSGDGIEVRGLLPQIPGAPPAATRVELLADGVSLLTRDLRAGSFVLAAPLPRTARQVKIELRFDHTETLPAPDNRPVAAQLEAIKITPAS